MLSFLCGTLARKPIAELCMLPSDLKPEHSAHIRGRETLAQENLGTFVIALGLPPEFSRTH